MSDTIKYRSLHIFDKMFFKGGSFRNAKHEKPEFTKRK